MSQTLIHPSTSLPTMAPLTVAPTTVASTTEPTVVVLQGTDPSTGHLATWHLTPLGVDPEAGPVWRVERVAGCITHPAVWMQAAKETTVVTEAEALALQERLSTV